MVTSKIMAQWLQIHILVAKLFGVPMCHGHFSSLSHDPETLACGQLGNVLVLLEKIEILLDL